MEFNFGFIKILRNGEVPLIKDLWKFVTLVDDVLKSPFLSHFDYLVELGELPANPYANFKIKASLFTPVAEKSRNMRSLTSLKNSR